MKAYKAANEKGMCRDIKMITGKVYSTKEKIELCKSGFHYCLNLLDVYNYYEKSEKTRIYEIEVLGEILVEIDKSVTNKMKIIRELDSKEILKNWIMKNNSGDWNSGDWNSGNRNSGNGNSGNWNSGIVNSGNRNSGSRNSGNGNSGIGNSGIENSGNKNSGDWNSGNRNSGNKNSGDWNSGNRNSGNRNSGVGNSGDWNSGDWNSGNRNSGYFCTDVPLFMFNKPTEIKWSQEFENEIRSINVKPIVTYIETNNMTEEEKINNPSHKIIGGFLRKTSRLNWTQLTEQDKEYIKSLPNFDDDIFEKISGIRLTQPKTIKVVVNGIEKEIDFVTAKSLGLIE